MSAMSGVHNARDSTVPPSGSTPKRIILIGTGAAFSAVFSDDAAAPCAMAGSGPASMAAKASTSTAATRQAFVVTVSRP